MCGGGMDRQGLMKMEIFEAGVESREANSLDGVSTTRMSIGWQTYLLLADCLLGLQDTAVFPIEAVTDRYLLSCPWVF